MITVDLLCFVTLSLKFWMVLYNYECTLLDLLDISIRDQFFNTIKYIKSICLMTDFKDNIILE